MANNVIWSIVLRHLADNSIRYKLGILGIGIALAVVSLQNDPELGIASLTAAVLASVFASFLLQIFPSDALDNSLKTMGMNNLRNSAKHTDEDFWFQQLEQAQDNIDISGRCLHKWIATETRSKRFSKILRSKIESGASIRILFMSSDNNFLAALEKEGEFDKPDHKQLIHKLTEMERFFVKFSRKEILSSQNGSLEVRVNFALPFYRSITRFDSNIQIIPYFEDRDTGDCPLVTVQGQKRPFFRLHMDAFTSSWNDPRHRIICGKTGDIERPHAFETDLIRHQQIQHLNRIVDLRTKSVYHFGDFDKGWEYLFRSLEDLPEDKRILRDFTMASVAKADFKGYSFSTYPAWAAREAKRRHFKIKMMIAQDAKDGECCKIADTYIYDFLRQMYSDNADLEDLLSRSLVDPKEIFRFVIVPSDEIANLSNDPFNIYGDMAFSRSEINSKDAPPSLQVSWKHKDVENLTLRFECLWEKYSWTSRRFLEIAKAQEAPCVFSAIDLKKA